MVSIFLFERFMPVGGPQDAGHVSVATGSRAFSLRSFIRRFRFSFCPALWVISHPGRATWAPMLFSLSSSNSQSLESLQLSRQWQRTPLPGKLPALVGTKRLLPLFVLKLRQFSHRFFYFIRIDHEEFLHGRRVGHCRDIRSCETFDWSIQVE